MQVVHITLTSFDITSFVRLASKHLNPRVHLTHLPPVRHNKLHLLLYVLTAPEDPGTFPVSFFDQINRLIVS